MNHARLLRTAALAALAVAVCAWPAAAGAWVTHENGRGTALQHPGRWAAPPTGGAQCFTAGTNTAQLPVPGCDNPLPDPNGAGALSLASSMDSSRAGWRAGAIMLKRTIPVTEGMDLTFKGAQWGGTGGDGIAVLLQNGDLPIDWGTAFAGDDSSYLGYIGRNGSTNDGLPNGLLGVGFDSLASLPGVSTFWAAPVTIRARSAVRCPAP
jgi:hypothetical protein